MPSNNSRAVNLNDLIHKQHWIDFEWDGFAFRFAVEPNRYTSAFHVQLMEINQEQNLRSIDEILSHLLADWDLVDGEPPDERKIPIDAVGVARLPLNMKIAMANAIMEQTSGPKRPPDSPDGSPTADGAATTTVPTTEPATNTEPVPIGTSSFAQPES